MTVLTVKQNVFSQTITTVSFLPKLVI